MWWFRDVTDHQRAEAALREQQALIQQQQADLIRIQQTALAELSTPLIPISDSVLVMPLIGAVDSVRAGMVMDALLEGVGMHRANAVIIDITGVQVVDTQVANALIQAAQAVRLLGAQVILTGVRPHVAQTLVSLGVSFGTIQTFGTLQDVIRMTIR